MMFSVDYSSHPPATCSRITDFLTNWPQSVRPLPLLYALYTYDCTPTHPANVIVKYAVDTIMVGIISHRDVTPYRVEGENAQKITLARSSSLRKTITGDLLHPTQVTHIRTVHSEQVLCTTSEHFVLPCVPFLLAIIGPYFVVHTQ